MTPAVPHLLQRETETARLAAAIERAATGEGGLVLVEGPAGIGKTAILREARAGAAERGMRVIAAVASELDRAFPYGVVLQLLEQEIVGADAGRRARLLGGAAARAEVVFDLAAGGGEEPAHAVLHGLYWLCANLADERPLALFVDDLHWADRASLRLLEYLARRLEGVPLAIVATSRVGEPGAQEDLIHALHDAPGVQHVVLEPLTPPAAAGLIEPWLGREPEPEFVEACLGATGGIPLLLHALAREAKDQGLSGRAGEAAAVQRLSGTTVVAGLQRRLRGLGAAAKAVAESVAVLGERRTVDDLVAVCGLDPAQVRLAMDVLVATGILDAGGALAFAHPLVRSAVVAGISPTHAADLHARAAAHLAAAGVRPGELAVHLLEVPPAGEDAVAQTLVRAAEAAIAEGAHEAALGQLRRALTEPPERAGRAGVLLELGELEQRVGEPDAMRHLADALAEGLEGDAAARAHAARGMHLLTLDPGGALTELEAAYADARDPALRLRLEAGLLDATAYLTSLVERRRGLLGAGHADPDASPAMLVHLAMDAAYAGRPVAETVSLVERALAAGFMERVGPSTATFHLLILTLRHAERADLAAQLLGQDDPILARTGSRLGAMRADHASAFWQLMFGSVAAAEAYARASLARVEGHGHPLPELSARVILAEVLMEQGRPADAADTLAPVPDIPMLDDVIVGPDLLSVRAHLRAEQGDRAGAEADLRRALEHVHRRGWRAPLKARAGLRLAVLLAPTEPDEARQLAEHEVECAREAGTPGALGASLRALARTVPGPEAIPSLREADAVLAESPMRLEHGWALHDLGALLRREGSRADSRLPLRQALEIADACEAPLLARSAREELAASGARPRRTALSGVASLTPSERRVAELAATGKTNREIAEALWVTRKTVEVHLGKVYGKLDIRTRGDLPAALGPPGAAEPGEEAGRTGA